MLEVGKDYMNQLKKIEEDIKTRLEKKQSFTEMLMEINTISPDNMMPKIKKAFRLSTTMSNTSTEMLEEVIEELEQFENELMNDEDEYYDRFEREAEGIIELNEDVFKEK